MMNRHERLQEQYEDSLFALLMDEVAAMEGQRAIEENERLQNDPAAAVPEDVDRRCMRTIHRHFARQKARAAGRVTLKAAKRVTLAAGIGAILFTTAFALSETVRVRVLNLVIRTFETNTEFRFTSADEQAGPQLEVGWVPEGYVLVDHGSDGLETWYEYQNAENKTLSITSEKAKDLVMGIDTEDAEVERIQIQGSQAMLVEEDPKIQLFWTAQDKSVFIKILGTGVERENIISVANELQY